MNDSDYIWRIECENGWGAYYGGLVDVVGTECDYSSSAYHPAPGVDGMSDFWGFSARLFGFGSINMARRWFYSDRDLDLWERAKGAVLVVRRRSECWDIIEGHSQLAFIPGEHKVKLPASWLHRKTIAELMEIVEREFSRLTDSVA